MIAYLLAKPERHKHLNGSIMEYGT
jgi:hypothetical protein